MGDKYSENQYDDDLTAGAGEYDEYDHTDAVDLFEFSNQDESSTSRLKSLILSIDWEITDDVLMQFNEELVYLEGIWSGEKIKLVYVQALQKISKYIYHKKANSHPNAIKLLLKLYYNLEKINSSEDLTDKEKKDILVEDVKRFESLKRQIVHREQDSSLADSEDEDQAVSSDQQTNENETELLNLKATVLGIDWEITEEELNALRKEVVHLEKKYAGSRPKLILLQGIGTLGAYIKVNKSNAHRDAFKLLHVFFESLEKIVLTPMTLDGEKAILFPAIEKFNAFKTLLGLTTTSGSGVGKKDKKEIQPALADFGEQESRGFQAEEEARGLGSEGLVDVSSHIDEFFGESTEDAVYQQAEKQPIFDPAEEEFETPDVDAGYEEEFETPDVDAGYGDADFADADFDDSVPASADATGTGGETSGLIFPVDRELALQGLDVETEADDDSDEEALPMEDSGVFAPALSDSDQASIYSSEALSASPTEGSVDEKIIKTLDDFFVDKEPAVETAVETALEPEYDLEIETEASFDTKDEEQLSIEDDVFAVASLSVDGEEEEQITAEDDVMDEVSSEIDAKLDAFFGLEPGVEELEDDFVAEEQITVAVEDDVFGDELPSDELSTEADRNIDAFFNLEPGDEALEDEFPDEIEIGGEDREFAEEEEVVFELVTSSDEEGYADAVGYQVEDHDISEKFFDSIDDDDVGEVSLDVSPDPVLAIGQCIDSINLKFDEKIIRRLVLEIRQLQERWATKTLKLSFLELLSTVTQHIDRYRFDSDPGAYELLKSNYDALELLEDGALEQNQKVLFGEISKVLKWQQNLLFEQTMPKAGE